MKIVGAILLMLVSIVLVVWIILKGYLVNRHLHKTENEPQEMFSGHSLGTGKRNGTDGDL